MATKTFVSTSTEELSREELKKRIAGVVSNAAYFNKGATSNEILSRLEVINRIHCPLEELNAALKCLVQEDVIYVNVEFQGETEKVETCFRLSSHEYTTP